MITAIEVHHFRGLRELSLGGLRRLTVLAGEAGSGKTALLEALFLAASNSPQMALLLRGWRGYDALPVIPGRRDPLADVWADLVGEGGEGQLSVLLGAEGGATRLFRIYRQALPPEAEGTAAAPVTFEWRDGAGRVGAITGRLAAGGLQLGAAEVGLIPAAYLPGALAGQDWTARIYADLLRAGQAGVFEAALRAQFPAVEALSVQPESGVPVLHVRLAGERRPRPMAAVSGSMMRLTGMLLGCVASPGGMVCVDEAERGFTAARLGLLWQQLLAFAQRHGVQVFASVQGAEGHASAAAAIAAHPDDVGLVWLERQGGACQARVAPAAEAGQLLGAGPIS